MEQSTNAEARAARHETSIHAGEEFEVQVGKCLLAVHQKNFDKFDHLLKRAQLDLLQKISLSSPAGKTPGDERVYPELVKLHALSDLDFLAGRYRDLVSVAWQYKKNTGVLQKRGVLRSPPSGGGGGLEGSPGAGPAGGLGGQGTGLGGGGVFLSGGPPAAVASAAAGAASTAETYARIQAILVPPQGVRPKKRTISSTPSPRSATGDERDHLAKQILSDLATPTLLANTTQTADTSVFHKLSPKHFSGVADLLVRRVSVCKPSARVLPLEVAGCCLKELLKTDFCYEYLKLQLEYRKTLRKANGLWLRTLDPARFYISGFRHDAAEKGYDNVHGGGAGGLGVGPTKSARAPKKSDGIMNGMNTTQHAINKPPGSKELSKRWHELTVLESQVNPSPVAINLSNVLAKNERFKDLIRDLDLESVKHLYYKTASQSQSPALFASSDDGSVDRAVATSDMVTIRERVEQLAEQGSNKARLLWARWFSDDPQRRVKRFEQCCEKNAGKSVAKAHADFALYLDSLLKVFLSQTVEAVTRSERYAAGKKEDEVGFFVHFPRGSLSQQVVWCRAPRNSNDLSKILNSIIRRNEQERLGRSFRPD